MKALLVCLGFIFTQHLNACVMTEFEQFHQQAISIENVNVVQIESSRMLPGTRSAFVEATFSNIATIAGKKLPQTILTFPVGACGGRNIVSGLFYVILTDTTQDLTIERGENRILGIELRAFQNPDIAKDNLAKFLNTRLIKTIREARKTKTFDVNASWYRALQTEVGNMTFPVNY